MPPDHAGAAKLQTMKSTHVGAVGIDPRLGSLARLRCCRCDETPACTVESATAGTNSSMWWVACLECKCRTIGKHHHNQWNAHDRCPRLPRTCKAAPRHRQQAPAAAASMGTRHVRQRTPGTGAPCSHLVSADSVTRCQSNQKQPAEGERRTRRAAAALTGRRQRQGRTGAPCWAPGCRVNWGERFRVQTALAGRARWVREWGEGNSPALQQRLSRTSQSNPCSHCATICGNARVPAEPAHCERSWQWLAEQAITRCPPSR